MNQFAALFEEGGIYRSVISLLDKSFPANTCIIQVRTAIVTVLTEIPVTDFEVVSSTIGILNEATQVREEISEEAQVLVCLLAYSYLETHKRVIGKQCRPRSDAT